MATAVLMCDLIPVKGRQNVSRNRSSPLENSVQFLFFFDEM